MDEVIGELAGRQHGVVARWQLLELGIGVAPIEGRIRRGSLHRLHQGVYSVGHAVVGPLGRLHGAVLACGPEAVLSHRSAAQAWGLMSPRAIRPEVTAPGSPRIRSRIVVHRCSLRPDEIREVDGIPVTSVPRTLLDIAAMVDERELENAWNEMEVRELTDALSVPQLLARHRGRRGVAALRKVSGSERPGGRTRNVFETQFAALLDANNLPRPRLNATIHLRGRFFEIDALWDLQRLAVELDGGAVHGTRRAFRADRERDRILLAEGFRTARVTWDQLQEEPAEIVADLRQALAPDPHPHPQGR